jgi:hypothetical protein
VAVYAQGRNAVLIRQSLVVKQTDGRMLDRARQNADRFDGSHDAPLRSLSGTPPSDARKAGMTEEELDAAVDVIAAVDAECCNRSIRESKLGIRYSKRRGPQMSQFARLEESR